MPRLTSTVHNRVAPALLTAAGVTMLAAGLLHYGAPADARGIGAAPSPSDFAALPTPDFVVPSLPPIDGSPPPPSVAPSQDPHRVATRIVIAQLGIDLPIIAQPNPNYPSCNVAMYY